MLSLLCDFTFDVLYPDCVARGPNKIGDTHLVLHSSVRHLQILNEQPRDILIALLIDNSAVSIVSPIL